MLDYYVIGSRIRHYRLQRGITQEVLAFQVNSSAAYISRIERGQKKPSLEKLFEIAEVLHVTINDFVYASPPSDYAFFDKDLQYMISMCTPEKQKVITKNVAEIIRVLLSE
jgi:transcriptional regulator with XRE-family HTH domain